MWLEYVCGRLKARNLDLSVARTGDETWTYLQQTDAPRLVLLNRMIPFPNGAELCRRLRARHDPFYTYVIMLMPNRYPTDELLAIEAGADECLPKPFDYEQLYARIDSAQRVLEVDKRLSQLNSRWRQLLDTLPFGVAAIDSRGKLQRMNTTFARQTGHTSARELVGTPIEHVFGRCLETSSLLDEVRMLEPIDDVEVAFRLAGSHPRPIRVWGRPLPQSDEAVYEIVIQEVI
jgi:PAS domain S-box-containing protein